MPGGWFPPGGGISLTVFEPNDSIPMSSPPTSNRLCHRLPREFKYSFGFQRLFVLHVLVVCAFGLKFSQSAVESGNFAIA